VNVSQRPGEAKSISIYKSTPTTWTDTGVDLCPPYNIYLSWTAKAVRW